MLKDQPVNATIPTDDVDRLGRFYAETPVGRAAWFKDPDGNLIGLIEFQQ